MTVDYPSSCFGSYRDEYTSPERDIVEALSPPLPEHFPVVMIPRLRTFQRPAASIPRPHPPAFFFLLHYCLRLRVTPASWRCENPGVARPGQESSTLSSGERSGYILLLFLPAPLSNITNGAASGVAAIQLCHKISSCDDITTRRRKGMLACKFLFMKRDIAQLSLSG